MRRVVVLVAVGLTLGLLAVPTQARSGPVTRSGGGPIATQAQGADVALFALKLLGNYTANENEGNGFGQFLMQLGFGDASAAKLAAIQNALNEINQKLTALNAKVDSLRTAVENTRCENIQTALATSAATKIKGAWQRFADAVETARNATKAQREALARNLSADIENNVRPDDAVISIHDALVGTSGSPSMINRCGFAFQRLEGDFVTSQLHSRVHSMVDYWQALEAEAAVLQIGVKVAAHQQAAAEGQYARAENNFRDETAKIRPSLDGALGGIDAVLDTRSHLLWTRTAVRTVFNSAAQRMSFAIQGFVLPNLGQLFALLKDCCNSLTTREWLEKSTPFTVPQAPGTEPALLSDTNAPWPLPGVLGVRLDSDKRWAPVRYDDAAYALLYNTLSSARWEQFVYPE